MTAPTPRCVAPQPLYPAALLDQPWDVRLAYFVEWAIVAHARLRQVTREVLLNCCHLDYCYLYSVGCVGILKDWLTSALKTALQAGDETLTLAHLERCALPKHTCKQLIDEAGWYERALRDEDVADADMRAAYGLGTRVLALPGTALPEQAARDVTAPRRASRRRPVRDPIHPAAIHPSDEEETADGTPRDPCL